jgi:type IX secretion system PorP/SprF family membrane protein
MKAKFMKFSIQYNYGTKLSRLIVVIVSLFSIFIFEKTNAQTETMYSQYLFNMSNINPAFVGNNGIKSFTFYKRSQWVGLEGAPQTNAVTFESPLLNNKAGIGVQFYDDKIGVEHATGFNTYLSTKIKISDEATISGGINIGLMNYRIDLLSLSNSTFQQNDIAYNNNFNKFMPILGAGIFYTDKNFYTGISIPSILKSRLTDINLIRSNLQKVNKQQVFISSGATFFVNKDLIIKPSVLIKVLSSAPITIDYNTNFWYKNFIGLGVSYRTTKAVVGILELKTDFNLKIGYAYDLNLNPIKYYSSGSHEIVLRYEFKKHD